MSVEEKIVVRPIGVIRTPYKESRGMPIQGKFKEGITGRAEIFPEYKEGLKDIEGFSHLIFIYHFDRVTDEKLVGRPFLEDEPHGIFSIRSPSRPNHIGLSVVKLEGVEGSAVVFSDVDIMDETPLLDIKPYVSYFDVREGVRNGWLDRHFRGGRRPSRVEIK